MKKSHLCVKLTIIGVIIVAGHLRSAETDDESAVVSKRLLSALNAYNAACKAGSHKEAVDFFGEKKMLTKSLAIALKKNCHLDVDPFLSAQDCLSGFVVKKTQMGDGVARITVAHKDDEYSKGDEGHDFIMLKEGGLWKIDDIDDPSGTLKQSCD